jgi:hypothetical protein
MEDENAPKQIKIDKMTKKSAPLLSSPNQSLNLGNNNNSLANQAKGSPIITNFCWSSFDSNKIVYATMFTLTNLRTLSLSDKIVIVTTTFLYFILLAKKEKKNVKFSRIKKFIKIFFHDERMLN